MARVGGIHLIKQDGAPATPLEAWLQGHLALVFAAFALSRLLIVPLRVARLVGSDKYYDFRHYFELARMAQQGFYPYIHYWMEYPPVWPWFLVFAHGLSTLLAAGAAAEFLFYVFTAGALVLCEIGLLILVWRIAGVLHGPAVAMRSVLLYALLTVPVYLWTGWFDSLPAALFLLSLYYLLTQRDRLSAAAAGIGIAAKIFPGLMIPLALCAILSLRRKLSYLAIALLIPVGLMIPLWIAGPVMAGSSIKAMLGRSSWETIWALFEGYFGAGAVAPFAQRLDAATATLSIHPASLPLGPVTLAFVAICLLFYARFWGTSSPMQVVAAAGLTLHLLVLFNKGYSPQYLMWMAPLIAIVFSSRRGIAYLVLLGAINLLEYPVYFHFFPSVHWLLAAIVTARTVLLALVAFDYFRYALPRHGATGRTLVTS